MPIFEEIWSPICFRFPKNYNQFLYWHRFVIATFLFITASKLWCSPKWGTLNIAKETIYLVIIILRVYLSTVEVIIFLPISRYIRCYFENIFVTIILSVVTFCKYGLWSFPAYQPPTRHSDKENVYINHMSLWLYTFFHNILRRWSTLSNSVSLLLPQFIIYLTM